MKKLVFLAPIVFSALLAGCVVTPRGEVVVAPPLPPVVEFESEEPVYQYQGYYYYYDSGAWYYSPNREGRRYFLPRNRWPRETRFKRRGEEREHERDWDRGRY